MATVDLASSAETPADFGENPAGVAGRWISEIDLALNARREYRDTARRIIKVYEAITPDGDALRNKRRYALLWSNTETLGPAIYARTPVAVVSRRYKDNDPVGRLASEVLERALNFQVDVVDFADVMLGVRQEFLLVGQGVDWVRYVPHMQTVTPPAPVAAPANPSAGGSPTGGIPPASAGGAPANDGQISESYEVVAWEETIPDHVTWDDFLTNAARKWSEVCWVARRAYMTRDELVKRFGKEIGGAVPLDHGPTEDSSQDRDSEQWKKAVVWEIWDKRTREAIWISKSYTTGPLDRRPDPLGLEDFFPCPRPLLATTTPDSIIPRPDYVFYESQAKDINELTIRIGRITDQIRLRGFYAAGSEAGKKLDDLLAQDTGVLMPVEAWAAFQDGGGVDKLVAWMPMDMLVSTLKSCIDARKQLLDDVFQITGIADIMRGDIDPEETATATRTKATWGSSRARDKQKELARFARDTLRIMAQVIATKFSAQTLAQMTNIQLFASIAEKQQAIQAFQMQVQQWQIIAQRAQQMGQQPPPQPQPPGDQLAMAQKPTWEEVQGLLKNNTMRTFRIEVETDSTIEPDDQDEKQRRVEFMTALTSFVEKSMPAVQLAPELLPVVSEALMWLVRGFRVGREMEDVIDRAMEQLQAKAAQGPPPQQQNGPNPQVEQMKGQAALIGAQAKMTEAQTGQFKAQTDRFAAQAGAQLEGQRIHAEDMRSAADRQADVHMQGQDIVADLHKALISAEQRRLVHDINTSAPVEVPTR